MKKNSIHNDKTVAVSLMAFINPEFGTIRLSLDEKGEPLFCGKDVCHVLGYTRTDNAVRRHVQKDDALKQCVISQFESKNTGKATGKNIGKTTGKDIGKATGKATGRVVTRKVRMLFVTESGLYTLVLGSKLEGAQRFKHWVTAVVLPQIRKTGGFIPIHEGDSEEDVRKRTEAIGKRTEDILRHTLAQKESLIDELLPKALYADNVLDSISCYTTTQIAKELGCTAQELNRSLCAAHVQYYQSGQYMLYADFAHMGLAKSRTHYHTDELHVHTRSYLVWTERGRKFIHDLTKKF